MKNINKYFYENGATGGVVDAENDEAALDIIRSEFGQNLIGISIVYTEENGKYRTVWLE